MQDGPWFIDHITKCLLQSLEEVGFSTDNVRHVALISAKTGYGIESLISKLNKYWGTQGLCQSSCNVPGYFFSYCLEFLL